MSKSKVDRESIENRLREAVEEFGGEAHRWHPQATWDELDVDSLDLVELAQLIEDEYGVELREAEMEQMKTVEDAVDAVSSRVA